MERIEILKSMISSTEEKIIELQCYLTKLRVMLEEAKLEEEEDFPL